MISQLLYPILLLDKRNSHSRLISCANFFQDINQFRQIPALPFTLRNLE